MGEPRLLRCGTVRPVHAPMFADPRCLLLAARTRGQARLHGRVLPERFLAPLPLLSCPLLSALQADGVNLEEWYQWLSAFTGLFCKKQP